MTPDISAIAQEWFRKWCCSDVSVKAAIAGAIEEATASLRAQLEKLQLEYEHAVKCMNRNCKRCNYGAQVAQESPLNGAKLETGKQ